MDQTKNKIQQIGLITAIAIVSANMIGTGVFTSLGFQVGSISSGFTIICLWFVGGLTALCGAFSYGELSAAMPRSGGEYHLLSRIFHPAVGFTAGWISVAVGFTAPIAAAAMAMGKYATEVLIDFQLIDQADQGMFITLLGLATVTFVTIIHTMNVKIVSSFQLIFTSLKIVLIFILIIAGLIVGKGSADFTPNKESIGAIFSAPFAISLIFVMYAYSGWNAATYIAGDIKNPGRNLPLSLFIGTLIVMILYVALNGVFMYTTPVSEMVGKVEVGYIAANYILGNQGAVIMGLLISLGLISAISSMIWAGPRVTQIMGEDTKIFSFLSKKNKNGAPHVSLLLQYILVVIMILTSSFDAIVSFIGFTLSISAFLTVLGVYIMRHKAPEMNRPYKTWGYPFTPAFFLLVTGWMLFYVVKGKPLESMAGLVVIAMGLGLYYLDQYVKKGKEKNQTLK